jgi:hypothetical protein
VHYLRAIRFQSFAAGIQKSPEAAKRHGPQGQENFPMRLSQKIRTGLIALIAIGGMALS